MIADKALPWHAKGPHLVAEDCAGVVEDDIGNKGAAGWFLNTAVVTLVAGVVPIRPPNRPAASTQAFLGAGTKEACSQHTCLSRCRQRASH